MRDATIILGSRFGGGSAYARAKGAELRARRLTARLTQRELALPLSGAYVSSVESGRVVPFVPALMLMLERPRPERVDLFRGGQLSLAGGYT